MLLAMIDFVTKPTERLNGPYARRMAACTHRIQTHTSLHLFDTWMPLYKGDEARQLRPAHNLCRNQQVFDATLGHHLGFAHLGDLAPAASRMCASSGLVTVFRCGLTRTPLPRKRAVRLAMLFSMRSRSTNITGGFERLQGISQLQMIHSS